MKAQNETWFTSVSELIGAFRGALYETDYESSESFAGAIEVVAPELSPGSGVRHFIFHSLKGSPHATALDFVIASPVGEDLATVGEPVEVPCSHCEFQCLILRPEGAQEVLQTIEVACSLSDERIGRIGVATTPVPSGRCTIHREGDLP